ncbi:hypothetical protein EJ110_NYTH32400 [Nymphaea thermarum]|nr:hypothetical protein EJ110_NYTH32400 [Nymphaea thermarum]
MQSRTFKALDDMSVKTLYIALLVIFFSRALVSEGSRHNLESKHYPKELPIKTITIDDGDIYDCMKLDSEPSMGGTSTKRKYAIGFVIGRYGGGEGTFSVWQPDIEVTNEMSLSQLWVLNEDSHNGLRMALEAGWMNDAYNTYLYNDNLRKPRGNNLQFRRSSNARYMPFGRQLQCSTFNGQIGEIKVTIKKNDNGDWAVLIDEVDIGYWPQSNYRVTRANKVQWGGEIVNRRITGRHTSTQMGSGHFSTEPMDDGDIYECKNFDSRPSTRDPSMSKRKMQTSDKLGDSRVVESESCPTGSFPVLKATKAGPLNFSALEDFASSRARSFLKSNTTKPLVGNRGGDARSKHEYAKVRVDGVYGGGEGTFQIWRPRLEHNSEMTLSQLWVVNAVGTDVSMSVEAGWMNFQRDWELAVDGTLIGFWPKTNYRVSVANIVFWGGEILNERTRGRHTTTQMGSGHFATEPRGKVAYVSKMQLYTRDLLRYNAPQQVEVIETNPYCYNVRYWPVSFEDFGRHITFGGPGYDPANCP